VARIPDRLRQQVIERAQGRCEYCQTQQVIVVEMEIDHIVPGSVGGETALENLCFACVGCNGFKLDYQVGIDPETKQEVALFNPRTQPWSAHFRWSENGQQIIGTTATGRATVVRLRMNRDGVVEARQRWVAAGWHPPKEQD
jgi:5-methylcytosine-specific restriction endonuclease McrA